MDKTFSKLAQAIIDNGFFPSSSDLNQCSVRVHDNPLLSELFIDGRIRSDLEFALQNNDQQAINELVKSERNVHFSDCALPRHMSPSDYQDFIQSCDSQLSDLDKQSDPTPSDPAPSDPAPSVSTSVNS